MRMEMQLALPDGSTVEGIFLMVSGPGGEPPGYLTAWLRHDDTALPSRGGPVSTSLGRGKVRCARPCRAGN